jgi:hypothetical protein
VGRAWKGGGSRRAYLRVGWWAPPSTGRRSTSRRCLLCACHLAGVSHASHTRGIERGRRRHGQVREQRGAGDTRGSWGHPLVRTRRTPPVPCAGGSRDGSPALSSVAWASLCTRPTRVTGGGALRCQWPRTHARLSRPRTRQVKSVALRTGTWCSLRMWRMIYEAEMRRRQRCVAEHRAITDSPGMAAGPRTHSRDSGTAGPARPPGCFPAVAKRAERTGQSRAHTAAPPLVAVPEPSESATGRGC